MNPSDPFLVFDDPGPCEYRVHELTDVVATHNGLFHRTDAREDLLAWSRVAYAIAATVGEPEGVSTVVFDLLVERAEGLFVVYRFAADPYGDAIPLAAALVRWLGADRTDASVQAMASAGKTLDWYPDLEAFQTAASERFQKA